MLTAVPVSNQQFHVFKVIDRTPGGGALKYKNILANSATSRWITGTSDNEAVTRTRGGYTISQDIDAECAQKFGQIIGKTTFTPKHVIDRMMAAEEEDDELVELPNITYPTGLIENNKKRNRENVEVESSKRSKLVE